MVRSLLFPLTIVLVMVMSGFTQTNETRVITVGSRTHHCIWHVPKDYDKPPVVFFVHGAFGSGKNFMDETKANVVADREKFIAVYPSASANGDGGTWADMSGTSDYPFYLAVIDTLKKKYSIDTNRIYMTGFSQGGFISFVAACKYSKIFAAVAPVSGHAGSGCTLSRPVSVYLTYGGLEDVNSFAKDRDIWVKLDSCPNKPTRIFPYPASKPQSRVSRLIYGPGAKGTYVIVDSMGGQQHQWPSAQNQAEEVWAFFKQFSLNSPTTNVLSNQRISFERSITVSYIAGTVHILGVEKNCQIKVTDTKGRLVLSSIKARNQFSFMNKPSGIYLVIVGEKETVTASRILVP
jgi:poly(3-hydroxybutyrate) depolymerase